MFFAISIVIAGIEPDPLDTTSPFWRLCYGSCPIEDQLPSRYICIGGICVLVSPTSTYYNTAPFQGATTADALALCIAHPCVPITGDPIHYNCNNGVCVPVSPSALGWGGADHQGTNALALCQAAVLAGTCVNTTTRYNCVPDGVGGTMCAPTPAGIYPDITSCNNNCGGVITFHDWYCVNVPPAPSNGNTGLDCQAVTQGNAPPPNHVIPLQGPYASDTDCINNGCGQQVTLYYCRCGSGTQGYIIDFGNGTYGGKECVGVVGGPAGGFQSMSQCEDDCLSWECDDHGNCDGPYAVSDPISGSYCSFDDIPNGGFKYWSDQSYINITGCDTFCPIPNAWVCMGGQCTEVLEYSSCINPNHVSNGTNYAGSCIDWAFANNMPSQGCVENDEGQCNANLIQPCGGGCGECDGIVNEMGMTEWPFRLYSSSDSYNAFDVVIGFAYPNSQSNSNHKYWYKPYPICDPGMGVVTPNLLTPWITYNCGDPAVIDVCESSAYGSGTYHPCTDLGAPVCETPPIINMAPPTVNGLSRFASQTCWEPC